MKNKATTGGLDFIGQSQSVEFARILIFFLGVSAGLFFILSALEPIEYKKWIQAGAAVGSALGALISWWCLKKFGTEKSLILSLVIGCVLILVGSATSSSGLRSAGVSFGTVIIMFTTWVLGKRAGAFVLITISVGLMGMALLNLGGDVVRWVDGAMLPMPSLWGIWATQQVLMYCAYRLSLVILVKFGSTLHAEASAREMLALREQDTVHAKEQLVNLNKKLKAILDASAFGVISTDTKGSINSFNKGAGVLLGFMEHQVLGVDICSLYSPKELAQRAQALNEKFKDPVKIEVGLLLKSLSSGKNTMMSEGQWNWQKSDRTYIPVKVALTTIVGENGAVEGYVAVFADVTDQVRAQKMLSDLNDQLEMRLTLRAGELEKAMHQLMQNEKLAALGSMVAGVSHEMSTPIGNALLTATSLSAVLSGLKKLTTEKSIKRQDLLESIDQLYEGMSIIEQAITHASQIMLNFKSVSVDQSSEVWRSYDVVQIVKAHLQIFSARFKKQNISFNLSAEGDGSITAWGYPGKLGQVLAIILSNTLEHAFENRTAGNVQIHVKEVAESIIIRIQDNGVGIDPNIKNRLFEPFFTTKMGRGGSGLGLSIAKSITEGSLKGTLTLHSEWGQGTTFEIIFAKQAKNDKEVLELTK